MEIFIGSSKKFENVAHKIATIVEKCNHTPIKWPDWFGLTDFTFLRILELIEVVDGAIFVLSPDDKLDLKDKTLFVPRDNVLIEAGVMFGSLGAHNVVLCKLPNVKFPTDWTGATYLEYNEKKPIEFENKIRDWLVILEKTINQNGKMKSVCLTQKLIDFEELISSAQDEIMLSSFFVAILQTSGALQNAINSGIKVRILLSDYWGNNLKATTTMLDGLNSDEKRVEIKLRSTLQYIATEYKNGNIPSNLEIRLIDYVFPTRLTIIDPDSQYGNMDVHISSYINRIAPKIAFHLRKNENPKEFKIFREDFERIWNDARSIDFHELDSLLD